MAHETITPTKTVRLDASVHARLKAAAALQGKTIESYLEEVVVAALNGKARRSR